MAVLVDTTALAERDREDVYQSAMAEATVFHEVRLLGPSAQIRARVEAWQLDPDVALFRESTSGIRHVRAGRHARREGPERVAFILHDRSGLYVDEGGAYELERDKLYVTHLNSSYTYSMPAVNRGRVVQVERSALGLSVEQLRAATLRLVGSPLYDLVRSHIDGLIAASEGLPEEALAPLAEITADLLRTMLLTSIGDADRSGTPGRYLVDRSILFMKRNYSRDDLNADEIAKALGVSQRYLFQQWATQPKSLAQTLLEIRMAAAREMMRRRREMSLAAIAHDCGIADASHFSRRFREMHGVPPRDFRALNP